MASRAKRIDRVIDKYGASVTLFLKPDPLPASLQPDDWPNPDDTEEPSEGPVIKGIFVPQGDIEFQQTLAEGVGVGEKVQGFFKANQDLNSVAWLIWQGGSYFILEQDAYELSGEILAQVTLLERRALPSGTLFPHT